MNMFSKELQLMDRNTVKYMIDELQEQLDSKTEQLDASVANVATLTNENVTLSNENAVLRKLLYDNGIKY